eukprot:gene1827-1112_t
MPSSSTAAGQPDLYARLGVVATATTSEIRRAFRHMALRFHPDKQVHKREDAADTAVAAFHAVKEAADVLLDYHQRMVYDAQLGLGSAREEGAISDTFDLFEDFELQDEEGTGGAVEVYQRECRCGGVFEVMVVHPDSVKGTTASAATTRAFMEYRGARRVRHVVECDCCSLVVEVAGEMVLADDKSNSIPAGLLHTAHSLYRSVALSSIECSQSWRSPPHMATPPKAQRTLFDCGLAAPIASSSSTNNTSRTSLPPRVNGAGKRNREVLHLDEALDTSPPCSSKPFCLADLHRDLIIVPEESQDTLEGDPAVVMVSSSPATPRQRAANDANGFKVMMPAAATSHHSSSRTADAGLHPRDHHPQQRTAGDNGRLTIAATASSSSCSATWLLELLPAGEWYTFLEPLTRDSFQYKLFARIEAFLTAVHHCPRGIGGTPATPIYPPVDKIFEAFAAAPFRSLKVVLLGQDPYHQPGQAHGLSFSVCPGVPLPPSLRNVYTELASDISGFQVPRHGYLMHWAKQGVLLLNASLTVVQGQANSHEKCGWAAFTDAVMERLSSSHPNRLVFLLWGKFAAKKRRLINETRHRVLVDCHPSPLSAHRGWFGCRCFSRCNAALQELGHSQLDWQLPMDPTAEEEEEGKAYIHATSSAMLVLGAFSQLLPSLQGESKPNQTKPNQTKPNKQTNKQAKLTIENESEKGVGLKETYRKANEAHTNVDYGGIHPPSLPLSLYEQQISMMGKIFVHDSNRSRELYSTPDQKICSPNTSTAVLRCLPLSHLEKAALPLTPFSRLWRGMARTRTGGGAPASALRCRTRCLHSAGASAEDGDVDLDEYEALLLQTEDEENVPTSLPSPITTSASPDLVGTAAPMHPSPPNGSSPSCASSSLLEATQALIDMAQELLPADGAPMRLTDLSAGMDLEPLESLPPPPGASCLSLIQFLKQHPRLFRVVQEAPPATSAKMGCSAGGRVRWLVQRVDAAAAQRRSTTTSTTTTTSTSNTASGSGAGSDSSDMDQLDVAALFLQEEMCSVLQSTRCTSRRRPAEKMEPAAAGPSDAKDSRNAVAPGQRRRRLQAVATAALPSDEAGGVAAQPHNCAAPSDEDGDGSEERRRIWRRLADLLGPDEVLPAAQLRARIAEQDPEVAEWLAGISISSSSSSSKGTASTLGGGGGLRRLLWRYAAEARHALDYDAASSEGFLSRAGVLASKYARGAAQHSIWTKPTTTTTTANSAAREAPQQRSLDDDDVIPWEVELDLDEEDVATAGTAMEMENEDEEAADGPPAGQAASTSPPAAPPAAAAAAAGGEADAALSNRAKRRRRAEALERERLMDPDALLAEHTRLAEERGWRSPAEVLDLLVECVPTFPVPVNQLVCSDVLIRLFGFKVSMERLVAVYHYYVVLDKDTLPCPTVCLHPERVGRSHPGAGTANVYYKRWANAVFQRRPPKPENAKENETGKEPAQASATATAMDAAAPPTPPRHRTSSCSSSSNTFVPLRRTIRSRVTLKPRAGAADPAASLSPSQSDAAAKAKPKADADADADAEGRRSCENPAELQKKRPVITDVLPSSNGKRSLKAPLSPAVVLMHDLLQGTAAKEAKAAAGSALQQQPAALAGRRTCTADVETATPAGLGLGLGATADRPPRAKQHGDVLLEALHNIYDSSSRPAATDKEEQAQRNSCAADGSAPTPLTVLTRALLTVPYTHFIPMEDAALRCGCDSSDALEDLVDRSQPTQDKYAAFLLHSTSASAGVVARRGRRLIRLRPLWIAPNSTGDLPSAGLPEAFLRKLLPTWRPLHKVLESLPEAHREALLQAAVHAGSLRDHLRLFGRSPCWVEGQLGPGAAGAGAGAATGMVDRLTRVRRYRGELELDDVEPLCMRVLYACSKAHEYVSLDGLIERARDAETAARARLVPGAASAPPPGEGVANMLREWPAEVPDLLQRIERHQALFEVRHREKELLIKRRSLFTLVHTTGLMPFLSSTLPDTAEAHTSTRSVSVRRGAAPVSDHHSNGKTREG